MDQQSEQQIGPALGLRFRRAVRDHAVRNYERDGWSFVLEHTTTSELGAVIGAATTEAEAIASAEAYALDREASELARAMMARA